MKKALIVLSLATFALGTTYAATQYDGDPVKTEKVDGDEKKKKKKGKKGETATTKTCSKSCTKTCTKKKEM